MSTYAADDSMTLHLGDALQVLLDMDDASVDAVITDPPYSSGGLYRSDRTQATRTKYLGGGRPEPLPDFAGDNRDQRSFDYWCQLWMAQALRITRPGGIFAVFSDWRQLPTVTDAVQAAGWTWRGLLAWAKPDPRPQLGRPSQACEFVVWATNGPRTVEGLTVPGWWLVSTPRDRHHQTEKPLQVLRDLVRLAPADGVVLDPFMGSGTTGVAARLEDRRFIGIELMEHYVEMSLQRMRAVHLPDGEQQGDLLADLAVGA